MTRFVKSLQSQVLPVPLTAADTASISTVSCIQDTIEMTDLTDNSSTNNTPAALPKPRPQPKPQQESKVDITPTILQHSAKDFAEQGIHFGFHKKYL